MSNVGEIIDMHKWRREREKLHAVNARGYPRDLVAGLQRWARSSGVALEELMHARWLCEHGDQQATDENGDAAISRCAFPAKLECDLRRQAESRDISMEKLLENLLGEILDPANPLGLK